MGIIRGPTNYQSLFEFVTGSPKSCGKMSTVMLAIVSLRIRTLRGQGSLRHPNHVAIKATIETKIPKFFFYTIS